MMRLVVFDDDAAIGRLIVRAATLAGLEATAVTNPGAFQENMAGSPPRVVVLDLRLGATDGVEQLRFLAHQKYTGSLILMSGFDVRVLEATATIARNLNLDVSGLLAKPIRVEELEQLLKRLLSAPEPLTADNVMTAIRDDELSLDFQPIVTRQPKVLKKLEALIRWDHPSLGRIPPSDFLPLAEKHREVMDALTEWVIGATVEAYHVLRELDMTVPFSMNISTQNLHDLTLPDRLAWRLEGAAMPTADLCFEVTETMVSHDIGRITDILTRIRLKGIRLAIDDFGTGYSSLRALRQLPFSETKIDQSFVKDLTTSRDSRVIVKSIIDLASNMEMDCVAEGVETEETATLLEQLGAHALQGYLIAPPMPIESIPAWKAAWIRGAMDANHKALALCPRGSDEAISSAPPVGAAESGGTAPEVVKLTPRQLDVMRLLSRGRSVKEIARELELSIGTVKVHLSQAYSSLQARNRVEAVIRANLSTPDAGMLLVSNGEAASSRSDAPRKEGPLPILGGHG